MATPSWPLLKSGREFIISIYFLFKNGKQFCFITLLMTIMSNKNPLPPPRPHDLHVFTLTITFEFHAR
jgi:hypothetical protein